MAAERSAAYTVGFAAAVCVVCALVVSLAAVGLQPRQQASALQYKHKNVLLAAGLLAAGEARSVAELQRLFADRVEARLVDLQQGRLLEVDAAEVAAFDPARARREPASSRQAPPNRAGISRLPQQGLVYLVREQDKVSRMVLAIDGLGMWGGMQGFIALDADARTVQGIAFYEQKETPGLGGEVANPQWQALWRGRLAYDAEGQPRLALLKGPAGSPADDPHHVDGLSGATITSQSVTRIVQFWLSDDGWGRWLRRVRNEGVS